ncbi:hypothetical protein UFOVP795_2 [uncultured Caudovirales phage]|uniref:Bacteriophage lambda, Stf, side tail fibre-repeat-2 n=1 Tax=uncultured Caudovirales phage TaxID=2100421 RepID=A0A6J5NZC6_9CAUD|nr:hypothetical protein UFOVP795_2 [uncultured Caudovirales phage]
MAIQTFTAAQVLTAAQMNSLQANDYNQTVSTKTASHTLVAADKGTRVVMNVASANTVTVNTSLFSAGDTLVIQNIGAGVTTVTAGTATVSSAGPLTIAQYGSGTLYFTSAGVSLWFPSAGPAASSGLTFITSGTITTSATAQINNVFSSTYDNYLMLINYTAGDAGAQYLQLGTSGSPDAGSNYSWALNQNNFYAGSGATTLSGSTSTTKWTYTGKVAAGGGNAAINFFSPNLAAKSSFSDLGTCLNANPEQSNWWGGGSINTSTQYTDITITTVSSTTSFTYKIYGYSNS